MRKTVSVNFYSQLSSRSIINRRQLTLVCRTREAAAIEWCKQVVGLLQRSMLCPVHATEMKLSKATRRRPLCRFRCQRGDCKKAGTEISITKGTISQAITPAEKALDVLCSFAHHHSYEACRRREAIQIDADNDPIDGWMDGWMDGWTDERLSDKTIAACYQLAREAIAADTFLEQQEERGKIGAESVIHRAAGREQAQVQPSATGC
jgi:hypothetical protein